ncbi:MAG: ydhP [Planctomycetaceae bacterium]|nr:ydhP [Planctomycetaceae bacterium]
MISVNSSVQHIASGLGASLGGFLITESADGKMEHFGTVGWIAATATLVSLWLAGRIRVMDQAPTSAEKMSLIAAAEASADVGEPLLDAGDM